MEKHLQPAGQRPLCRTDRLQRTARQHPRPGILFRLTNDLQYAADRQTYRRRQTDRLERGLCLCQPRPARPTPYPAHRPHGADHGHLPHQPRVHPSGRTHGLGCRQLPTHAARRPHRPGIEGRPLRRIPHASVPHAPVSIRMAAGEQPAARFPFLRRCSLERAHSRQLRPGQALPLRRGELPEQLRRTSRSDGRLCRRQLASWQLRPLCGPALRIHPTDPAHEHAPIRRKPPRHALRLQRPLPLGQPDLPHQSQAPIAGRLRAIDQPARIPGTLYLGLLRFRPGQQRDG